MKGFLIVGAFMIVWGVCLSTEVDLRLMTEEDLESLNHCNEVEVAREAYIYCYPMVTYMRQLFQQAVWPHSPHYFPLASYNHQTEMIDWTFPMQTDPSVDHLYSQAWLDLERHPVVVNIPDIPQQRYYGVTIVDGYDINIKFISPRRRDGSWAADQYVIVGPGFRGSLSSHFDDNHIVKSLSRFVYVISRNEVHGPDDVPNVIAIQNGYTLTSLDGNELPKHTTLVFPFVDGDEVGEPIPEAQIFFSYANFIINYVEIEEYESYLFKTFAKIEVGPSMEFIGQNMSQQMYRNIEDGIADGSKNIDDEHMRGVQDTVNGWTPQEKFKVVHSNYLGRAVNARYGGPYISDPEEAIIYFGMKDADGDHLNSVKYDYTLTFAPGQFPPVAEQYGGFWSVTVYLGPGWGPQRKLGTLVHNPIDRYAINGKTTPGLVYDANGALTIYVQKTRPDTDAKAANWLPTPDPEFGSYKTGVFHMIVRYYEPDNMDYFPPGIAKAGPATL